MTDYWIRKFLLEKPSFLLSSFWLLLRGFRSQIMWVQVLALSIASCMFSLFVIRVLKKSGEYLETVSTPQCLLGLLLLLLLLCLLLQQSSERFVSHMKWDARRLLIKIFCPLTVSGMEVGALWALSARVSFPHSTSLLGLAKQVPIPHHLFKEHTYWTPTNVELWAEMKANPFLQEPLIQLDSF